MTVIKLAKKLTKLPALPKFSDEENEKLENGELVKQHGQETGDDGFKIGTGMAYMIVDRPPQDVWDQLLDFENYSEFFPNIKKCVVYDQKKNDIFVEFNLRVGLLVKVRYHIHHTFAPNQSRLTWKMDDSKKNDFKESIGTWTAWPMDDGRSLIGYSISLESGRAIPKMIEDMIAQTGLNNVMESVRKRVHLS